MAAVEASSVRGPSGEAPSYRWIVLALLFLSYVTNSIDRTLVSIVGQAIKEEFGMADWQLGLLSGLAFSLLYVTLGFPLARLADRRNRVNIISICLFIWSIMTALCGLAGSYVQLLLCRLGVGVGEAGGLPTSHSLISDFFEPSRRSSALAIFGLGLPVGGLIAMIAGGYIADAFGWRFAFLALGLPGVILAVLLKFALREPPRGRYEADRPPPAAAANAGTDTSIRVVRAILSNRVVRHVVLGMTLAGFFSSPGSVFMAPYLVRGFDLTYTEIGLLLGLAQMGGISISSLAGGFLADWLGRRKIGWYAGVPAISVGLAGPTLAMAYFAPTVSGFTLFLFATSLLGAAYLAPSYSLLYRLVAPNARATTTAVCGLAINLVGLGAGPVVSGLAIDVLTGWNMGHSGYSGYADECVRGALAQASVAFEACSAAQLDATREVLAAFALMMLWPVVHFLLAAKHLPRDPGAAARA